MRKFSLALLIILLIAGCTVPLPVLVTATPVSTSAATASPTPRPDPTPTREIIERDCSRLSYNINFQGLQDADYLLGHLERLNPCAVLVMDGMGFAWQIAERLPDALVVHRKFSRGEGEQCLVDPVEAQLNAFIAEADSLHLDAKARLLMHGCSNEPSWWGSEATLRRIVNAEIALMNLAADRGVRVCSGNWGVGNFTPQHVEAGLYNDYLRAIAAGNHVLCVHEYTSGVLPFGVGQWPRSWLLDAARVQPDNWPDPASIRPERIPLPAQAQTLSDDTPYGIERLAAYYSELRTQNSELVLPPYWHLFRVYWLYIIADENGIPRPPTLITEGLHDHLSDIDNGERPYLSELEAAWGMNEFMFDLRGAPSHCRLWVEFYYPGQSCVQSLMMQYEWWDAAAVGEIIGVNLFTWSYSPHWISFNLASNQPVFDVRELHRRLEADGQAA